MSRVFRYLKYLIRHKWFVFRAGLKLKASIWRLLIHDWTKFLPSEFFPYLRKFYGPVGTDWARYDHAWNYHQKRNKHHWQYWVLIYDNGRMEPLEMPDKYVREMVADWAGAGKAKTGKWDLVDWYYGHCSMKLHPNTRKKVEHLINTTQL